MYSDQISAFTRAAERVAYALERLAAAHERQAIAMEASNEFEKELNEVPEAPEKGEAPEIEPLYVPDGVEPVSLKSSKVIPFHSLPDCHCDKCRKSCAPTRD